MRISRGGFTLVELMLAAAILLIAISGLIALLINCIFMNESNNNLVIAVNDAQYVLEQIKNLTYGEQIQNFIANFEPDVFQNLDAEEITFPTANIGPAIAEIKVKVRWTERGNNNYKNTELSTLIAK